jgi:hypothetical protein
MRQLLQHIRNAGQAKRTMAGEGKTAKKLSETQV